MFNYITLFKESIFVINNNKIIQVTNGKIKEIVHTNKIVILEENYFIDEEKKVFQINEEIEFLTKLEKTPSKLLVYNENLYLADRFGDVIRISKDIKLILGNMTYNTDMIIHNDLIYTSDKYGRIRVSNLNGKILFFMFICKSAIISMCLVKDGFAVCTNSQLFFYDNLCNKISEFSIENIRKVVKYKDDSVIVLGDKSFIYNSKGIIKDFGFAYDVCVKDEEIIYINKEKELVINEKIITNLEDEYLNFLKNLN